MALSQQRDLDELRSGLERWLDRPVGAIDRPTPGWSCETLIVEGKTVVRLPPLGDGIFPTYDLAQQEAVQRSIGAAGVPVAAPSRYEADPSFLGAPFIAMPFVAGAIPSDLTATDPWVIGLEAVARDGVWRSFLEVIATLHATPTEALGLRAGLANELALWDGYLDWACDGSPPPALADALTWCSTHRPSAEPDGGLLWGDVRLGNVIFDPSTGRPAAVLDFDMVSVGPIEMDLAWFLALEALQNDLVGTSVRDFGSREDAIALVERHIARPLLDLAWHEVFALVRASAISTRIALLFERAGQRSMFRVGADPSLAAARARIDRW